MRTTSEFSQNCRLTDWHTDWLTPLRLEWVERRLICFPDFSSAADRLLLHERERSVIFTSSVNNLLSGVCLSAAIIINESWYEYLSSRNIDVLLFSAGSTFNLPLFCDFLNHFLFLWFPPKMSGWTDGRMDRMDQSNSYLWLFLSKSTIDHVLLLNNNEGDQHRSHDLDNVDSNAILSTDRSLFLLLFNFMDFLFLRYTYVYIGWIILIGGASIL